LFNTKPINVNNEFVSINTTDKRHNLLYRIPEFEYQVLYRLKSATVTGYFDFNKEILVPHYKNGIRGYNVFAPFHYYDLYYNRIYLNKVADHNSDKGAIIVKRGW